MDRPPDLLLRETLQEVAVRSHVVVGKSYHKVVGDRDPILNKQEPEVAFDLEDRGIDQPLPESFRDVDDEEDERGGVSVVQQWLGCSWMDDRGFNGALPSIAICIYL